MVFVCYVRLSTCSAVVVVCVEALDWLFALGSIRGFARGMYWVNVALCVSEVSCRCSRFLLRLLRCSNVSSVLGYLCKLML